MADNRPDDDNDNQMNGGAVVAPLLAYLPGPLICGCCGGDFICTRRGWTMTCPNPNCDYYGRNFWWPNVVLEEVGQA